MSYIERQRESFLRRGGWMGGAYVASEALWCVRGYGGLLAE